MPLTKITPQSTVLLEKLIVPQLAKKFLARYGALEGSGGFKTFV